VQGAGDQFVLDVLGSMVCSLSVQNAIGD
jgi:hypothetical protein